METSELSTESLFGEELIFSPEGSPARTFPMQACELSVLRGSEVAYGLRCTELLARYDPTMSLWKTSQVCFGGAWEKFLETWPKSGMTRNGQLFRLVAWAHHIHGKECSFWPTPTVTQIVCTRSDLERKSKGHGAPTLAEKLRGIPNPQFAEWLMGYPQNWTEIEDSETR